MGIGGAVMSAFPHATDSAMWAFANYFFTKIMRFLYLQIFDEIFQSVRILWDWEDLQLNRFRVYYDIHAGKCGWTFAVRSARGPSTISECDTARRRPVYFSGMYFVKCIMQENHAIVLF